MTTNKTTALVKRLIKLKASCERLQVKRDRLPYSAFPSDKKIKLNDAINRKCGEIMHTERCVINTLLREVGAVGRTTRRAEKGANDRTEVAP